MARQKRTREELSKKEAKLARSRINAIVDEYNREVLPQTPARVDTIVDDYNLETEAEELAAALQKAFPGESVFEATGGWLTIEDGVVVRHSRDPRPPLMAARWDEDRGRWVYAVEV